MTASVQSSVVLDNDRRWLTLDNRLVAPFSFLPGRCAGRQRPAKVRKGLVEFLAMAHHFGGAVGAAGSMRHAGVRAVSLGLASVIAAEHLNGKKVVHYRLTEGALVADLAERCFYTARQKGSVQILPDGEGARVPSLTTAAAWTDVPTALPARPWPTGAKVCPRCRCTPDAPCTVLLEDGCGSGQCAPAGVYDLPTCSACEAA